MQQAGTIETTLEDSGTVTLRLGGGFDMDAGCADSAAAEAMLAQGAKLLRYNADRLENWDSSLVAVLYELEKLAAAAGMPIDRSALPHRLAGLLAMAASIGNRAGDTAKICNGPISCLGAQTTEAWREMLRFLDFAGNTTLALVDLIRGRSKMRWRDFWAVLQNVSVEALPIVVLISFLVGVIIAFLGAVVLKKFGAEFAISYLIGYGILREMGAIMTGVIMAGRTGAAFAAQLGSMKVSEEIDALQTLGISPNEFLVLPRVVTLVLMMPLLTVFADLVGIFGGYLVAVSMMGVASGQFFIGLDFVAGLNDFALGLFKAMVFGVLIATSGCMKGMQCRASADAVGEAATKAVVLSITLIIFANTIIDWAAAHFNV